MAPESDMAERMARVETKIDFLIGQLEKLPPSPVCVARHGDFDLRITGLERWQSRIIGVFLALNVVLVLAMEKLRHMFFGGGQ